MKIRIRNGNPFMEYEVAPDTWRRVDFVEVLTASGIPVRCHHLGDLAEEVQDLEAAAARARRIKRGLVP